MVSGSTHLNFRCSYSPKVPSILKDLAYLHPEDSPTNEKIQKDISTLFPNSTHLQPLIFSKKEKIIPSVLRVGVLFSGGQAPGGHNVITGLFDALKEMHAESQLFGFLNGFKGLIEDRVLELTTEKLALFRNQGGFDLLGTSRSKIEKKEEIEAVRKTVLKERLDALVVIGGDDSNTNAAFLAEDFMTQGIPTTVIGIPKTIDGDLKNEAVEISFGFDSASKTYSELIGNLLKDAKSQGKYYFFVRLMGRSASHLTLECALKTHPNLALISEEIKELKLKLADVVSMLVDLILERAKNGKHYGVILIPEGIIEAIPECLELIRELGSKKVEELTETSFRCFKALPLSIQQQLLLDKDPHGNVQVSKIESERLLISLVEEELKKRKNPMPFNAQPLFFGYEGRSCLPSNFDANYTYSLGRLAALLSVWKKNGYLAAITHLKDDIENSGISAFPIVKLLWMEERKGVKKPVIQKALVDLKGSSFQTFAKKRADWALEDDYLCPGPIQFFGPKELSDKGPL